MLLLSTAAAPCAARQKTYYVSPQGDNAHSGLSIDKPLKSINRAIGAAVAGDTVYVLSGTYKELVVFSGKKGLPENPICLLGLSTSVEEYPVIDGGAAEPSSEASNDWITISNSEWIEISRLKFTNGWTLPIKVSGSSYLTFRSCHFWGGKRVINAGGPTTHHILVEDCFWDQGGENLWRLVRDKEGVDAWTSMHHGAMEYFNGSLIDFSGTGGSMVIRRNTIVNAFNGIRYRGRRGFDSNVEIYDNRVSRVRDNDFEPEYYTYNLHVYHNASHNIHRTLSVDNVEGGQIFYYGNVVTADTDPWTVSVCSGLWKIYGREGLLSYPIYAFNNSLYAPGVAFSHMPGKAMYLKHWNNAYVFLNQGRWDLNEWDESDEFDYDISNRPWSSNLTTNRQEVHGIIADAGYVEPAKGNLMLQPGSKGIDAGKVVSLKEFEWTQQFDGKAPDIGAFERENLVEGPAFRFMIPPEGTVSYKERPRIVRSSLKKNELRIHFSAEIDASSVKKDDFELYKGEKRLVVSSVTFPRNNYELVLDTESIPVSGELSLWFKNLPLGMNGERATAWASTMKIHMKTVATN